MLNILFMGTPDFAEESLKAIDKAGFNILGVVTNPDKPKGRGMKMVASPVKEYALERSIPVYQPVKVRNNPEFIEEVKKIKQKYTKCCLSLKRKRLSTVVNQKQNVLW